MARPTKADKKTAISVKLPPWLIGWMDRQPESRAKLIETALSDFYQIPDFVKKSDYGQQPSQGIENE